MYSTRMFTSFLSLALFISFFSQFNATIVYQRGLTDHFISWLNDTAKYEPYGFNRTEFFGGSFGGKDTDDTPITRRPVIFIHGNSDQIIGEGWASDGFRYSIEYFMEMGYTKAELYGSMWGFADIPHGSNHINQMEYVMYNRKFVEAVLLYTGAKEIDVISHSMGVTIARRLLKGGVSFATENPYYIGEPLTDRVNTFIGIAGANYGIPYCNMDIYFNSFRICNKLDGGYPGSQDAQPWPADMSQLLQEVNQYPTREAANTYALLSLYDQSVPARMFSRFTSEFPGMNQSFIFDSSIYDHVGVRDLTSNLQYNLVTYQSPMPPTNPTTVEQFLN